MFIPSSRWKIFAQNFHFSILILFLTNYLVSNDNLAELSSLDWILEDEDNEAILRVTFRGEILTIPLQKAPFCRLTITHKCDCFVLRKDQNTSDWDLGSFVYCDGKVYGEFMNSTDYFEVAPSNSSKSQEHLVTRLETPEDPIEEDIEFDDGIQEKNINSHYFEPLPEYYPLIENETGYVKCFFAVDQKVLDILPEENIDIFLQNLVNRGSHYFHTFNILIIYFGWSLALSNHTLNATTIQNFIDKEYRLYDGKMEYHSIILLTTTQFMKGNSSSSGRATINSMCKIKKYGIYVMYRKGRDEISKRNQVKTLIHEIGHQFGIQHINKTECSGKEPPGVVWIMRSATNKPGPLKWSPCSKRYMRKNRHIRSCLRMEVNPYKPFCGDGLVEDGEECDCIVKECGKCCNKKCRLKERSKCSNGPCCDVSTCTFTEGIQCRAAHDSCDIPELCDGKSRKCPPNYVVANGYRCGNETGNGYCFNGRCGSHQDVCNWIYVVGHVAREECYDKNSKKDSNLGGCGPVFPDTGSNMLKCEEKDKYCGKIWCENEELIYTKEFEAIRKMEILQDVREKRHNSCSTLVFKEGGRIRMDPTFVQNGSECGNGKMCIQQACVPLPKGCPKNCPGIKIVHPYTKEELPAFILNEPDPGKRDESPQDNFFLIYVITISFTISMLISTFYMHTSEGEEDSQESVAVTEIHSKEEEENSLPEIHQPDHSQQDSVENPSTLPPQAPNMDITQETLSEKATEISLHSESYQPESTAEFPLETSVTKSSEESSDANFED